MIVYTGGTFDLLHRGHVAFLSRCAELGSVVVALNTDAFVEEYKGRPPVIPYADRAAVLEACRHVAKVVPNRDGPDSRTTIEAVAPDVIVVGSDWAAKDYHGQMGFTQAWLDERGIGLCYLPYTGGVSTTRIRERL